MIGTKSIFFTFYSFLYCMEVNVNAILYEATGANYYYIRVMYINIQCNMILCTLIRPSSSVRKFCVECKTAEFFVDKLLHAYK